MKLPKLGVGLTYISGIDPIIINHPDLVDVLEIEPQTIWFEDFNNFNTIRLDKKLFNQLKAYPCAKLIHSIGFPVGGGLGCLI